jgi:hypothetical protein
MVTANVNAGHSGLRYEISDEPTANGCVGAPTTYTHITAVVHGADATAKTWVADDQFQVGNPVQSGVPMKGTVDILAFDVYPCQSGPCNYSAIDSAVQQIKAAQVTNWEFIIQDFNASPWRWPTPTEIQAQFDHWRGHGATGYWVYAWDYLGQQVTAQPGNVAALQQINLQDPTIAAPSVSGTVKDAGGALVAGAWVSAYQGGSGVACCTFVALGGSDGSGNYTFALPPGTYKFYVNPPPAYSAQWNGGTDFGSATAVVVSGPTVVNVTLFAKITGAVKDATGAPVSGAWVSAAQGGSGAACCTFVGLGQSDGSGNFTFALPPGTYKFYINPPPAYPGQWNGGTDFASATAVVVSGPTVVNITVHQ